MSDNPTESTEEKSPKNVEVEQVDYEKSFEELGLDARLIRALIKKSIKKPTPIQIETIPQILEGKNVVARAKTGSGKTFAYLLPLLHKLFSKFDSNIKNLAPSAFIVVPTRELCQQVCSEVSSLIELCRVQLKAVQLTSTMAASDLRTVLAGQPDILISTPGCIHTCLKTNALNSKSVEYSLSILILDEADLLLSYGYENDLKALTPLIPKKCQRLLMSATSSADVEKLKKFLNIEVRDTVPLPELRDDKDEIVPKNVQQFSISCTTRDKRINIIALLKLEVVQKKVLIFTNTIDMSFWLKLFFEQFGIKSVVLNAELPQNSRLHILEQFNAGLFDYLIATDDSHMKDKEQTENDENLVKSKKSKKQSKQKLDSEFGVVRGIDFKNVHTVINYEMPLSATGYVHRIGRTGRAHNTGASVSLVAPEEMEMFEEIKSLLGETESKDKNFIAPFPLLSKNAVESLRYRAEDVARSITKLAVREARAQELRNEIINSEKLKAHFQDNPKDLDLLKHDKSLSKKAPASHLRHLAGYLVDPTTQEASKILQHSREASKKSNNNARRKGLDAAKPKSKDPLKSFSFQGRNRNHKGGKKRKERDGDDGGRKKKQSS
jgi:ATP-dependent RNA helicase DDX56/DBP9